MPYLGDINVLGYTTKEVQIKIDGFFLGIGHKPNSDIFNDVFKVAMN